MTMAPDEVHLLWPFRWPYNDALPALRASLDSQGPGQQLMPWALAIEAQRARLGRRKVSTNIF